MENSYIFVKYLSGNWIIQSNILSFKNKKQKKSKNNILIYKSIFNSYQLERQKAELDISNLTSKYQIFYVTKNNTSDFYIRHINPVKRQKFFLYFKYIRKGFLEVIQINLFNKVKKKEYIYMVSSKIFVLITVIQDLENRYLGAKISSCIKLKNKKKKNK